MATLPELISTPKYRYQQSFNFYVEPRKTPTATNVKLPSINEILKLSHHYNVTKSSDRSNSINDPSLSSFNLNRSASPCSLSNYSLNRSVADVTKSTVKVDDGVNPSTADEIEKHRCSV